MTDETSRGQHPADDPAHLEDQLAQANDRLAFYASFDRLIQDNIARSGELMRDALALREQASADTRRAQAELERVQGEAARLLAESNRRAADERRHFAEILLAIQGELLAVQDTAAQIARRVGGVLGELGAGDFVPVAWAAAPAGAAVATDEPVAADTAIDATTPAASDALPPSAVAEVAAQAEVDVAAEVVAEAEPVEDSPAYPTDAATATDDAGTPSAVASNPERAVTDVRIDVAPEAVDTPRNGSRPSASESTADQDDPSNAHAVMVLIHGVPRAAAALSLQRHLAGLGHIDGVEAREYAEGILRLQVTSRRPLDLADLRAWDGGAHLEPIHVQDDVIEVRLPGALGF